ncbi:MAG: methyl coenzyme M reductase system, component A2 [Methanomassiliicoccaceae archaeon]|jgi:methyl coenzyme M reductase system subunit A2|nr:methyl coenzyme M reductase system, component A2 [Methanomassiliicoccaceae archaeon]
MMREAVDLLIIDNVSKQFNGRTVLKDVSAKLRTGSSLGLIGKSAAGKSVLINMVRGNVEYKPDKGKVIYRVNHCTKCGSIDLPYDGAPCSKCNSKTTTKDVDYWSLPERDQLREEIKGRIAIMMQRTFALFGDRSVMENIAEALPQGLDERERTKRIVELLEFVNLTHRTTHIARDLSGGEKQRTVLARQLAKDPLFFLADEPTGTLDPKTADIVHNSLIRLVESKGMCMVFASHWPEAIDKMADDAIWLDAGNVIMHDAPEKVTKKFMEEYKFEKRSTSNLGDPIIIAQNAKKYFFSVIRGVVKAVDDVTFDIKEREIFALVGTSGAGKTTTSRMIAGMSPCTGGSVKVKVGDDLVDMSEAGPEGKGRATPYIGFLHQEYSLYPFDTILQNLTTCIGMKMPAELAKVKAIQTLMSVGFSSNAVEKILYAYPDTLSVGECQRIAFAQVLIQEPRIVILDEPTGTMDPITKVTIANSVLRAREEFGETFVIVSHDMDFIQNCCDRGALMRNGKIVMIGSPSEIVKELTKEELAESGIK